MNKVENVKLHVFNQRANGPLACETRFVLYEVQTTAAYAAVCGDSSPQS
nr:hypothetical protein [uncultured Oscillibacter sp.]